MPQAKSYHDRLIDNIREQAAVRGIPEDGLADLKEKLEEKYGTLVELPDRKLRQVQQELGAFLNDYIGAKRTSELGEEEEVREEWLP